MYSDKILLYRTRAGLSQAALGNALGVSATAVYKWERGQSQPDITALTKMAELFSVTVDELLDRAVPVQEPEADPVTVTNITVMARAFRQMTAEEQEKYIAVGKALYEHAFADGKGGKRS